MAIERSDQTPDRVRETYQGRAKGYGTHIKTYTDQTLNDIMREGLSPFPESEQPLRALDLACGRGDGSKHLREASFDITYMDVSEAMIKKGIEKGNIPDDDRRIIIGDVQDLSGFEPGIYDVVMMRYAFHDVKDRDGFLASTHRILRLGGKAQITDMCVDERDCRRILEEMDGIDATEGLKTEFVRQALELYNTHHGWKVKGDPVTVWIPSRDELHARFEAAGLRDRKEGWYQSKVKSRQWFLEGQITEKRLDYLNKYFLSQTADNEPLRRVFNIRHEPMEEGDSVSLDFPVTILTGTKTEFME